MNELQKRTWAEISLPNIRHNYEAIRASLPAGCRFLGVVKADAYGHGAAAVSRLLQEAGADYLAVSCLDEALELRNNGIEMPILILGHVFHCNQRLPEAGVCYDDECAFFKRFL